MLCRSTAANWPNMSKALLAKHVASFQTGRHEYESVDQVVLCYAGQKSLIPSQKGVGRRRGRWRITWATPNAASPLAARRYLTQTLTLRIKILAESLLLPHKRQLLDSLITNIIRHQEQRSRRNSSLHCVVIRFTVVKKKMAGDVYK